MFCHQMQAMDVCSFVDMVNNYAVLNVSEYAVVLIVCGHGCVLFVPVCVTVCLLFSANNVLFLFVSDDLMDILSTDIISLAYDSLPCKPEILRWLFFISMLLLCLSSMHSDYVIMSSDICLFHTRTHTHMRGRAHTYTHTHTHTHAHTGTHMHVHTHVCTHTLTHTQTHTHTHTHTHIYTCTHTHIYTRAHTHAFVP